MRTTLLTGALLLASAVAHADISINSGGPAVSGYLSDRNYSGGSAWTYSGLSGIYATERWTNTNFTYNIPVTAGQLQVTLHFRESCSDCAANYNGANSENVAINGTTVLSNFSLALGQQYDGVYVIDNPTTTLRIQITAVHGEAYVNAIDVVQLGGGQVSPPTVSLSANPTSVASGGASTLTWSSTNATSCTASGGWSGARTTSGTASTGPLTVTTSFALACAGSGGNANQSVTVAVSGTPPPAPTVTFSANPTSIAAGGSSTLTWSSMNATSCSASAGWSGSKALSGTQSTGTVNATRSYTLTCNGAGGSASQSAQVTVVPVPTVTLSATPTSVPNGAASTLTWSSTNATGCTASEGWTGAKAPGGTQSTGALTVNTRFTLVCTGTGGSATQRVTVSVTAGPAPTVTLTANPTSVASGGSSTLTWSSSNATSCTASGAWSGAKSLSGTQATAAITSARTYTLGCTGNGQTTSRSVTVTILAPPTLTFGASPTTVSSGDASTLTWSTTNATSCNASGGWTGAQSTAGTQDTGPLTVTTTFTLTCSGAGGTTSKSTTVSLLMATSGLFPLHTQAGKRYLIDSSGRPFFVNGDTPWDLIHRLTDADIETYLNDRQAQGINTLLVELMEHNAWTSPAHVPNNVYGDRPFTTPGDFSTPNEAYMAHVATMLQKALDRGMLIMITPAYVGYSGGPQGWYQEMESNGPTKLRAFGQYLANRFAAYPNIVWVAGGDFAPTDHSLIDALANGIRDVNSTWLQTFHGERYQNASDWVNASETWFTLNAVYTDELTVLSQANAAYASSTLPFFLIESRYETGYGDGYLIRQQAYVNNLSGGMGYLLGNEAIWVFDSGWQALMNGEGARSLQFLGQLWTSRAWELLVPDGTGKIAYASDGSFAIAYARNGSITVDLNRLAGSNVRAQWYDPANGAYSDVVGSPFTNSGSRTFTRAGSNSNGDPDWVLVLDSQ